MPETTPQAVTQSGHEAGPLLRTLRGENLPSRPIWLMRQAGRYLPEYRELRAEKGGFLALVYDTDAAAEVTVQPIRRFGFDGAILFSDILIVPYAMGQNLQFLAGEGPHLSPRLLDATLESLTAVPERLSPIYETVAKVKAQITPETTLLGFAGSPWTVATYMVAGEGSRDHHDTRAMAYRDPSAFQAIIDAIADVTIEYLSGQVDAGAQGLQLFDSWAGSLSPAQFERWVIAPNAKIAAEMQRRYPHVPVIGFPKGAGEKLAAYARETGVNAVGVDETIDPLWAARELPAGMPVQGNLDPLLLLSGGPDLEKQTIRVLEAFADRPHVFNLGHGIGQFTPIENVEALLKIVRGWSH
ncbi:MAG: uroporphyrinogen decarboxylase [Novosphingobium sp. 17-62-19]|uniref:uroporphyrinogen decarboxylase n=1 Tax=Novosphingobium sp. 17-62-19 TaxID=1970406 RepID=UPI000BD7C853|nr:uroporphyrinogen decarboxylase [Novosphingobium sp. 17-62-19]OYX95377.1 MAG: uroporphyrinogen decarboxylase [Novosphingobium sp. 35-62-5]OZA17766.1 MAG: uroporphyrinogen decarboxylase [Novosphingobium sp. 17-62-19]HQS96039.1 uroporphyrinogen decarboxylase [Novosphingobium sp.]